MTPEQAHFLQTHMQAIQPILPTPEKKWYDRLADSILGDDPGALIWLSFTNAQCKRRRTSTRSCAASASGTTDWWEASGSGSVCVS